MFAVAGLAIWTAVPSGAAQAPDLDGLTTQQAADDLCSSKFTSTALVSAAITRARANRNLNAFVTLDEAGAMKAAAAFDAGHRKRSACKPLGGVPIVIKDNIEVAGLPSSAGTPALKGFVPRQDAPVVEKLRAAGAIIIGKTDMHELAFGISGFKTDAEPGARNAYDSS
jgi:mandelamide amidase